MSKDLEYCNWSFNEFVDKGKWLVKRDCETEPIMSTLSSVPEEYRPATSRIRGAQMNNQTKQSLLSILKAHEMLMLEQKRITQMHIDSFSVGSIYENK